MTKGLVTPGLSFLGCVPTGKPQESTGTKTETSTESEPREYSDHQVGHSVILGSSSLTPCQTLYFVPAKSRWVK